MRVAGAADRDQTHFTEYAFVIPLLTSPLTAFSNLTMLRDTLAHNESVLKPLVRIRAVQRTTSHDRRGTVELLTSLGRKKGADPEEVRSPLKFVAGSVSGDLDGAMHASQDW